MNILYRIAILIETRELYIDIMQRPFPAPHIITELVSKRFPTLTQQEVYTVVQRIKQTIKEHEQIAALQNN